MNLSTTRAVLAAALTAALPDATIHAYRPTGSRKLHGWLQLTAVDTEDATYGELRTSFDVVVPIASDQGTFERAFDLYGAALLVACSDLGRGVTVRPYTETIDAANLLCLVATIVTETPLG